jgi:putative transposase
VGDGRHLHPNTARLLYLAAVMDWASRRVLSWRVSISLDSSFCVAALEEAIARYGRPNIVNTDQGVQFTSTACTSIVLRRGIQLSMDGKGCWRDNTFIERLWRTLKYEEAISTPTTRSRRPSPGSVGISRSTTPVGLTRA